MRMVGDDEEPSAKEVEEIIRNVAAVAIDGAFLRNPATFPYC